MRCRQGIEISSSRPEKRLVDSALNCYHWVMEGPLFDAFISYSHAADGRLAPELQGAIARFAKPWYRRRALRVFRDETTLDVTPELWPTIERALTQSRYFILLASPAAATSKWVQREVEWWIKLGRYSKLLIVLTDGKVIWNDQLKDFDWTGTDALPRLISGVAKVEPRYLDLSWARKEHQASVKDPRFHNVAARLAAKIRGTSLDDLVGEDIQQHKTTVRLVIGVISLLVILAVLASGAAWLAQEREAEAKRTLSMSDFFRADALIAAGKRNAALAYLARAIRADPSNLSAGQRALLLLQEGRWYLPEPQPKLPPGFEVELGYFLPDGGIRLIGVRSDEGMSDSQFSVFDELGEMAFPPVTTDRDWPRLFDDGRLVGFTAWPDRGQPSEYYSTQTGALASTLPESVEEERKCAETLRRLGQLRTQNGGSEREPKAITVSPSRRFFAASLGDHEIVICDADSGAPVKRFKTKAFEVLSLRFSPDEKRLLLCGGYSDESGATGTLEIFALVDKVQPEVRSYEFPRPISWIEWLPDSEHFLVDGEQLWKTDGYVVSRLDSESVASGETAVSADGRTLLVPGLRESDSPHPLKWRRIGNAPFSTAVDEIMPREIGPSPSSQRAKPKREGDGSSWQIVLATDNETATSEDKTVTLRASEAYQTMACTPDGAVAVGSDGAGGAAQWDGATGELRRRFTLPQNATVLAVTPKLVVVGTQNSKTPVWNLRTGSPMALTLPTKDWEDCVASPNGRRLLVNHRGLVETWNLETGEKIAEGNLAAEKGYVGEVVYSPAGTFFVSWKNHTMAGGGDGRIWDAETLTPLSDVVTGDQIAGLGGEQGGLEKGHFDRVGLVYFTGTGEAGRCYVKLGVPEVGPVPEWLADLSEAVGGLVLSDSSLEVPLDNVKRREIVADARSAKNDGAAADLWVTIVRWWLDEGINRKIAPGSTETVKKIVEKRLSGESAALLLLATDAVPDDVRVFQQLATLKKDETYARRAQRLLGISGDTAQTRFPSDPTDP